MLDIKFIINDPELVKNKLRNRLEDVSIIDEIISVYNERKFLISITELITYLNNQLSRVQGVVNVCIKMIEGAIDLHGVNVSKLVEKIKFCFSELEKIKQYLIRYIDDISNKSFNNTIINKDRSELIVVEVEKKQLNLSELQKCLITIIRANDNHKNLDLADYSECFSTLSRKIYSFLQDIDDSELFNAKKESYTDIAKELKENNFNIDKLSYVNQLIFISGELDRLLSNIPNIPDDCVPNGSDESYNEEKKELSADCLSKKIDFEPKTHDFLGKNLNLFEEINTRKMSGSRFLTLVGDLAMLEISLAQMFLDHAIEHGYIFLSPPLIVSNMAMFNSGQLPKFDSDSYKISNEDFRLIPTAEVSLVNMVADKIFKHKELPIRYTAYTPCFRSEAGSSGKDTKGLIRNHQFFKVEIVSVTDEDSSETEFHRMVNVVASLLQKLQLKYRVVKLCDGDMGFSASVTYDFEVWMPGQNAYREVSSCSNCKSFQAIRMNTRYKDGNSGKNKFVHTLNGSCIAIGRIIAALLENYQCEDGTIDIPKYVQRYFKKEKIL